MPLDAMVLSMIHRPNGHEILPLLKHGLLPCCIVVKADNDYSHDSLIDKVKEIKPHLGVRILSVAVNVVKELLLAIEPPSADLEKELSAWEKMGDGLEKDVKYDK